MYLDFSYSARIAGYCTIQNGNHNKETKAGRKQMCQELMPLQTNLMVSSMLTDTIKLSTTFSHNIWCMTILLYICIWYGFIIQLLNYILMQVRWDVSVMKGNYISLDTMSLNFLLSLQSHTSTSKFNNKYNHKK